MAPFTIIFLVSTSFLFTSSTVLLYQWLQTRYNGATYASLRSLSRKQFCFAACCSLLNFSGMIFLSCSFFIDPASSSIAASITAGATIFVALISRMVWKEPLSLVQWIGAVLAVAGVIVVGAAGGSGDNPLGIIFALLCMFMFTLNNLCMKYVKRIGVPPALAGWILSFVQGCLGASILIIQGIRRVPLDGIDSKVQVVEAFMAGVLLNYGLLAMNYAFGAGLVTITMHSFAAPAFTFACLPL